MAVWKDRDTDRIALTDSIADNGRVRGSPEGNTREVSGHGIIVNESIVRIVKIDTIIIVQIHGVVWHNIVGWLTKVDTKNTIIDDTILVDGIVMIIGV